MSPYCQECADYRSENRRVWRERLDLRKEVDLLKRKLGERFTENEVLDAMNDAANQATEICPDIDCNCGYSEAYAKRYLAAAKAERD